MEGICWKGFWRVFGRWLRRLGKDLEGNGCEAIFGLTHICKNMKYQDFYDGKTAKSMIKYYGLFYSYQKKKIEKTA